MVTFRELRLQSGLTIAQLARRADVDFRTAKRADDGERIQEIKAMALLQAISNELGIPLSVKEVADLKIY